MIFNSHYEYVKNFELLKESDKSAFEDICNRIGELREKFEWVPIAISYNENDNLMIHFNNALSVVVDCGSYITMDFYRVPGFERMSELAKEVFIDTYKMHIRQFGIANKAFWIPKKVIEKKDCIEVYFDDKATKNGRWLQYNRDSWY